jgi:hypothetical protein
MEVKFKKNNGYVSLFSIFLITIILVISGFYGWEKYQKIKYPEKASKGEIKGPKYYYNGIVDIINSIIKKKEIKGKRAIELAEGEKMINDKAGLYSVQIPNNWEILINESARGSIISNFIAQSSYFKSRKNEKNLEYIDAGARLSIQIFKGENKIGFSEKGGHVDFISSRKDINVNGKENTGHIFKEPKYPNAQIMDGHVIYGGNTYLFRLTYNPENFSDAEFTFREIVESLKFLK